MEVKFNIYRGSREKIVEQGVCKIDLQKDHAELDIHYKFKKKFINEMGIKSIRDEPVDTQFYFTRRSHVTVEKTVAYHFEDEEYEEPTHMVMLNVDHGTHWLYCKDEQEADRLYTTIVVWLRNPQGTQY